jgi:hypothetical protein
VRHTEQPIFIVHLRAQPGTDAIKSLRMVLKFMHRYGMKCLSVTPQQPEPNAAGCQPGSGSSSPAPNKEASNG